MSYGRRALGEGLWSQRDQQRLRIRNASNVLVAQSHQIYVIFLATLVYHLCSHSSEFVFYYGQANGIPGALVSPCARPSRGSVRPT